MKLGGSRRFRPAAIRECIDRHIDRRLKGRVGLWHAAHGAKARSCAARTGDGKGSYASAHAGNPERKSFYGETRQDVAQQMRAYAARDVLDADLDLTLAEYLAQWLADADWRPNTYRLRRHAIEKHIVAHIGARRVADLNVDDVKLLFRIGRMLASASRRASRFTLRSTRHSTCSIASASSSPTHARSCRRLPTNQRNGPCSIARRLRG